MQYYSEALTKFIPGTKLLVYFPYFLDSGSVLGWVGLLRTYYSLLLIIYQYRSIDLFITHTQQRGLYNYLG